MTQDELDKMWHIALRTSIEKGEMYTRYEFAKLVAAKERKACETICDDLWGSNGEIYEAVEAIRARGEA